MPHQEAVHQLPAHRAVGLGAHVDRDVLISMPRWG